MVTETRSIKSRSMRADFLDQNIDEDSIILEAAEPPRGYRHMIEIDKRMPRVTSSVDSPNSPHEVCVIGQLGFVRSGGVLYVRTYSGGAWVGLSASDRAGKRRRTGNERRKRRQAAQAA